MRLRAEDAVRRITAFETDAGQLRRLARPVLRFTGTRVIGVLDLQAVDLSYALEFVDCRFDVAPDLRQARLTGIELKGCVLPGLDGRSLHSKHDVRIVNCLVQGSVDLTDGDIGGSLDLRRSRLVNPDGDALRADRLRLSESLIGTAVEVDGRTRIRGLRTGGNVEFDGASLHGVLDAKRALIGGDFLCRASETRRFHADAPIILTNARIGGDLSARGALLTSTSDAPPSGEYVDRRATIVADRAQVSGVVDLTQGFESTGTVRIVNAHVGDSVRLTGSTIDMSDGLEPFTDVAVDAPGPYRHRALHLAGTRIDGDIDGREARIAGQIRIVDVAVRGAIRFDEAVLSNRNGDVVEGWRVTTGANLDMRSAEVYGSVYLPEANIGANLDLRWSRFVNPGWYRRDMSLKPTIDLQNARIGRDLVCAGGFGRQPFVSRGEIRLRSAEVGRQVDFQGAEVGGRLNTTAIYAYGLITQELRLDVAVPPRGAVTLRHARCATFADNDKLWDATGLIDLHDFRYDALREPIELDDDRRVNHRLVLLRNALGHVYRPDPYDQLAAMLRTSGNDDHAATVQLVKQRQRYIALADSYRVLGPLVLLWSLVQRWVIGYGFRPMRVFGVLPLPAAPALALIATQNSGASGLRIGLLITLVVLGCVLLSTVVAGVGHRLSDFATSTAPRAVATALAPTPFSYSTRPHGPQRPDALPSYAPLEQPPPDPATEHAIAVEAYLDTDDVLVARAAFAALDDIVELLGYERPEQESIQRGSWWRRTTAKLKTWLTSDEVTKRRIKVERALELVTIDGRQADVDVRTAEAVARLIASLQDIPQGCLRAGSILVLKYQGDNGPVVMSRNLSQLEIRALERFPEIQTKPRYVLDSLATAVSTLEDDAGM
ncbi:hypothetical protein [Actinophytocola algeriensis]|uniref:Uncharacterized protein n=1 Tax=Actinophytocola algeriensis TaxID=1768010 RepID=A0A7W7PZN3_9PSEU|nr:hypothetical protein [Actinophytocola algeriensis]MBB4904285.1 hypothetical protein [Actinophytocola algeriensis]MBE1476857.1 hypothetical protein [Actinophytocola algeriensis]